MENGNGQKPLVFTTGLVTTYAKRKEYMHRVEKWVKRVRDFVVEQMKDEHKPCPANGPYILELAPDPRAAIPWKDEFRNYIIAVKMKAKKPEKQAVEEADKLLEAIAEQAEKKAGVKLLVKVNPAYRTVPASQMRRV